MHKACKHAATSYCSKEMLILCQDVLGFDTKLAAASLVARGDYPHYNFEDAGSKQMCFQMRPGECVVSFFLATRPSFLTIMLPNDWRNLHCL